MEPATRFGKIAKGRDSNEVLHLWDGARQVHDRTRAAYRRYWGRPAWI